MILVDANVLLYAYDSASAHHEAARTWLETIFSGPEPVGLSWAGILAFLRISTNQRLLQNPFSVDEVLAIVCEWLERPTVTTLLPGPRHWEILRSLVTTGQARGPLITDAHLAALAVEHGASLATSDRDFTRFPGLRLVDPFSP